LKVTGLLGRTGWQTVTMSATSAALEVRVQEVGAEETSPVAAEHKEFKGQVQYRNVTIDF
jgi:hypothetical protein